MKEVTITIRVPVRDIDLSACKVERWKENSEFWGGIQICDQVECDLSGATYNGLEIEDFSNPELIEKVLIEEGSYE